METVCYLAYFDGSLKSLQMLQNVISKFLIQTAEKFGFGFSVAYDTLKEYLPYPAKQDLHRTCMSNNR